VKPIRVAILTLSDAVSRGLREDVSGDLIETWARDRNHDIVARAVIPDEEDRIRQRLVALADGGSVDVVLTSGGTGFTERDVTPEATGAAIERNAPGIAEALRLEGAASTPAAWLSRGVAGIRARTLLVNLPGSASGVRDGLDVLDRVLDHAVQLLRGHDTHTHPDHG
jgi:molybdopterin adenylyltransferase